MENSLKNTLLVTFILFPLKRLVFIYYAFWNYRDEMAIIYVAVVTDTGGGKCKSNKKEDK